MDKAKSGTIGTIVAVYKKVFFIKYQLPLMLTITINNLNGDMKQVCCQNNVKAND
jgi:hypothetical protein